MEVMLYKNTKVKVNSPDGDSVTGLLLGDTLTP